LTVFNFNIVGFIVLQEWQKHMANNVDTNIAWFLFFT